ncbi:MAG: NADH:ubiquinone reductase (Na(+)-transporting) subunit F [Phycisphaerae bacterium]
MTSVYTVLIAAGLSCLVTAVLAGLLVVAERYLVNYGQCTVDVNDGAEKFEVRGGNSLLMTLRNQGIYIPSACGGKGTCAYCKVKIPPDGGGGPVAPTEEPLLTEQELKDNWRISCQCKVREDVRLYIPEELLYVKEFEGVLERVRDLTHDIKELRIKLTEPPEIDFVAGQYIQLEAPPYAKNPESVFRAYSVSSNPSEKDHVELIVRLVPGGICTTYVFEHLKEGDPVRFTGPYGEFRLTDNDRPMVWIAGGSGMAPFWAMVRMMKEKGIERDTTYFFGAVQKRDMFYVEELRALEKELPWFHYKPALSGDLSGQEWDGETGLITEVVDRHIEDGKNLEGYLCGSPGMIDASIQVLRDKGIPESQIFYDKFA